MSGQEKQSLHIQEQGSAPSKATTVLWKPEVGPEANSVIQKLPPPEREQLQNESCSILSQCNPPDTQEGHRTGLVVGYVQSGKTLSFTTVSALAHDNGYRLVLVIAGSSTNLLHQSTDRLLEDLEAEGFWGKWQLYRSDDADIRAANAEHIRADLQRWRDGDVEEDEKKTVLITVMKERAHLDRVIRVLSQLDLSDVPSLVIDDEADQASLNIGVRRGEESSTYRRVLAIREILPNHTYLQYTATPQALLLINLIDQLSPDFGQVLTPGSAYTGGKTFFDDGLELIRPIPQGDLPGNTSTNTSPPESLVRALQVFFVGVATGIIRRYSDARNRSMMIHPTHRTDPHATYVHWVRTIKDNWERILELGPDDRDRVELIGEFEDAYNDILSTTDDLPPFDHIVRRLPRAIRETRVEPINAVGGSTPVINWKRNYAWVVVGGQALDRGFTVEGLTVTYMPRSLGVGNADTLQQRARWFGYKAGYLGYCRVYLPEDVIDAFRDYVTHEEDVRKRLIKHLDTGRPLKLWKRAFILSGALNPTRTNVLSTTVSRGNYSDRWFSPRSPHISSTAISENRSLVEMFVSERQWEPSDEDPRLLNSHRHEVTRAPLRDVYERLLVDFTYVSPRDSLEYTGALVQIGAHLDEHPDAFCTIYRMRPTEQTARGTDEEGEEISQLFQGAYPVEGDPKIYPGDRRIRAERDDELTIQIHEINIFRGPVAQGELIAERVPVIAAWIPSEFSAPWVVQESNVT
jgi:hypothetical protein